ncbi:MAG: uridine diphosphate-N-acetylglucosamine-binding protein YvcK [Bacillota bacterium]|nr:uridine diphosphate-N-acetylglucosamine-binding protein YvcK [Bacillota bacterium]
MNNDIKILVIGGGSGISVILRGIKKISKNISAVVTVADDGGSSGILRKDMGMLPPGDIRNCILALSKTEEFMEKLMQHRFKDEKLSPHNLGNLLIAALVEMTGSFEAALSHMHDIFAVTGRVLPVSLEDISIVAELEDDSIVQGESKIPYEVIKKNSKIRRIRIVPENAEIFEEVPKAIAYSDIIMIGPGSLYTSILPNLLVKGVSEGIRNSRAKVVYCGNLLSQPGETSGMKIEEHVFEIEKHVGARLFDTILVNSKRLDSDMYAAYKKEGAKPLFLSEEGRQKLEERGIEIIERDFIEIKEGYIRHNADLVAKELLDLVDTKIFA